MKLKFRALNIHREILLSLSMTHSNFTQMFTLLLRHYSYSGLEFNLNISQENLVLEHSISILVIVLPYFHLLCFMNGRYDSLKDGKGGVLTPEKVFGLDSDFDRTFKVHFILLEWFV